MKTSKIKAAAKQMDIAAAFAAGQGDPAYAAEVAAEAAAYHAAANAAERLGGIPSKAVRRLAAAALGRSRTPKKATASRENGKRGGRPPLPSCRQCGAKVKATWWRAMNKAGFAPRHLSCPSCGCEGVEAWPRPE